MGMILTSLGLALFTAAAVWIYLRKEDSRGPSPGGVVKPSSCPRCRKSLPNAARRCPHCGIPLQIFEVVSAPAATSREDSSSGNRTPHAVVRADLCVGCSACVEVCPEPGAIRVVNKLAVVDRELCRGHGECVRACPVSGIFLSTGDAVQRVRVPDLSPFFETSVPGLYVVGELGGRGLIKNAVNEGKIAAEHVAQSLGSPSLPGKDRNPVVDLAVVGSGPAGLSAGLEALRRGLRYVILEQGTLADSIRKYPRHKILLAEPVQIPLYGDLWVADASKETLLAMWERVMSTTGLRVETGRRVESVEQTADCFRLLTSGGVLEARRVVLALGRRGTPRRLEVPGEELDKVFYDIVEMEAFRGRRVLVVGGGDSAVESAVGLANQPGTRVHLSYRGTGFDRVKERNQAKLRAGVAARRIALLLETRVRVIRRAEVVLATPSGEILLPNDDVIVRIGGEAPFAFLERIGVRLVEKDLTPAGEVQAHAG